MKKLSFLAIVTVAVLGLVFPVSAGENPCNPCGMKGTHFSVNDPMGRNSFTFTSTAPLEDIVGTSTDITGHIMFDPQNPKKAGYGELTIPVASLNTGIPLRDEHLQGKDWLNAARYPNIVLKITSTRNVKEVKSSKEFQTYDITVVGELTLHGKTRDVEIPGRLTYIKESDATRASMPGDLLAVRASFEIALSDYGIKGMGAVVGSKVGETIALSISFRGSSAPMAMAGDGMNPCNPCGGKAMNPCNPCGGKATNPCNPCGGKAKNPCNPCGPKVADQRP